MNGLGRRDLSFSAPRLHQKKREKKRKPPSNTNPPKRPTAEAAVCANRRTSHVTPVCSFGFYCVNSTECKQEKKQLKNRDVIFLFCMFITCGGRRGRRLSLQPPRRTMEPSARTPASFPASSSCSFAAQEPAPRLARTTGLRGRRRHVRRRWIGWLGRPVTRSVTRSVTWSDADVRRQPLGGEEELGDVGGPQQPGGQDQHLQRSAAHTGSPVAVKMSPSGFPLLVLQV